MLERATDTKETAVTVPPAQGFRPDHQYRLWTADEVDFDRFPAWRDGGPSTPPVDPWCVSTSSVCKVLSSPSVVAADDGKITLKVYRMENGREIVRHPLYGTKYNTDRDADRAAFEAGVTAFMIYVADEVRYGLTDHA